VLKVLSFICSSAAFAGGQILLRIWAARKTVCFSKRIVFLAGMDSDMPHGKYYLLLNGNENKLILKKHKKTL